MVSALEAGYRLLDTAVNYGNEAEVGEAIRRSGVPRDEIVVQTKVPGRTTRTTAPSPPSRARSSASASSGWTSPSSTGPTRASASTSTPTARSSSAASAGLVRSVGVSNFTEQHLADVIEATGVTPVLNQVELHPLFPQEPLRAVHERLGIVTEAWSPLGKRNAPSPPTRWPQPPRPTASTPAQAILRWHVQLGVVPLPKSSDAERQRANLDVFGFELTPDEMAAITALGRADGRLFGGDPDTHEEM